MVSTPLGLPSRSANVPTMLTARMLPEPPSDTVTLPPTWKVPLTFSALCVLGMPPAAGGGGRQVHAERAELNLVGGHVQRAERQGAAVRRGQCDGAAGVQRHVGRR